MQRNFQNQSIWEKIAIQYQHLTLFQREKIYLYGISIYRTHATGRSMKAILLRVRTLTLIIFEWHLISVIAFLSNFEIWLFWQPSIISATDCKCSAQNGGKIIYEGVYSLTLHITAWVRNLKLRVSHRMSSGEAS